MAAFVGDAIQYPVEILKTVVHGPASVVGMFAQGTGAILRFQALEERGHREQLETELDEFVDQMDCVIGHCSDQFAKMPLREKVKHVTAFGAELIIPGRAFKVVHNVCLRMRPVAIGLFHALRDEQKAIQVAARVEGIAETIGMRVVEGAQEAAGATKVVLSDAQLLLQNFHGDLMRRLKPEIAGLRILFDGKIKGFGGFANKYLKIAYEHILGFELSFSRRGVPSISGLHHDFMNFIEQKGLLRFSNKIIYDSGFYSAEIIVEGKAFQKTFFPAHWSREKVINAIYEAYNDFAQRGYQYTLQSDGKYLLKGTIKEGVEIEMYMTKNGKIVTAYPKL